MKIFHLSICFCTHLCTYIYIYINYLPNNINKFLSSCLSFYACQISFSISLSHEKNNKTFRYTQYFLNCRMFDKRDAMSFKEIEFSYFLCKFLLHFTVMIMMAAVTEYLRILKFKGKFLNLWTWCWRGWGWDLVWNYYE